MWHKRTTPHKASTGAVYVTMLWAGKRRRFSSVKMATARKRRKQRTVCRTIHFDVPEGFRHYRRHYRRQPDMVIKEGPERIVSAFYVGVDELSRLDPHVVANFCASATAVASNHVTISENQSAWMGCLSARMLGERRLGVCRAEAIFAGLVRPRSSTKTLSICSYRL